MHSSAWKLQMWRTWTFQHDNDAKQKAKLACHWLQQNKVTWQSPDLNIIEPLWGDLKLAVHARQPKKYRNWRLFARKNGQIYHLRKYRASSTTMTKYFKLSLMLKGAIQGSKNWVCRWGSLFCDYYLKRVNTVVCFIEHVLSIIYNSTTTGTTARNKTGTRQPCHKNISDGQHGH